MSDNLFIFSFARGKISNRDSFTEISSLLSALGKDKVWTRKTRIVWRDGQFRLDLLANDELSMEVIETLSILTKFYEHFGVCLL